MANIKTRIAALEKTTTKHDDRQLPLSFFYGEPLPDDFYTNPKYKRVGKSLTLADFYGADVSELLT